MFRYVLRRIAAIVPILFGVSVVCFSFIHLAPGDAITALAGDNASAVVLERIRPAASDPVFALAGNGPHWKSRNFHHDRPFSLVRDRAGCGAYRDTCSCCYRHEFVRWDIDGNDRGLHTPDVA
jgi:hypothetical protein